GGSCVKMPVLRQKPNRALHGRSSDHVRDWPCDDRDARQRVGCVLYKKVFRGRLANVRQGEAERASRAVFVPGGYRERGRFSPQYFFMRAERAARSTAVHPGARVAVREAASAVRSAAAGAIDFLWPARDLPRALALTGQPGRAGRASDESLTPVQAR